MKCLRHEPDHILCLMSFLEDAHPSLSAVVTHRDSTTSVSRCGFFCSVDGEVSGYQCALLSGPATMACQLSNILCPYQESHPVVARRVQFCSARLPHPDRWS
ncbi:hypothetical protein DPEC_G00278740 [Dallia pectoralis]|uniref:Uncharacterized protein n=1 Tax=Dallia pectoralis TaxID=75939 RepID=A0ACC2FMB2_DALPE|nr:hypothetical protein DPEC_G00278740 [Dallia pectoralis]